MILAELVDTQWTGECDYLVHWHSKNGKVNQKLMNWYEAMQSKQSLKDVVNWYPASPPEGYEKTWIVVTVGDRDVEAG